MNKEEIELLAKEIIDKYKKQYRNRFSFIEVFDIAEMLGFNLFFASLQEKGVFGVLGHNMSEEYAPVSNYIVVDGNLDDEMIRIVVADLLMKYAIYNPTDITDFELTLGINDDIQYELILPKEEFLLKYKEYSKQVFGDSNLMESLCDYFFVNEEAITKRCESLELNTPYTYDEAINLIIKGLKKSTNKKTA